MNVIRLAVCIGAASALAGCTTDNQLARAAPAASSSSHSIVTDSLYVARVEAIARRRGIGVTWVNPPVKRLDTAKN